MEDFYDALSTLDSCHPLSAQLAGRDRGGGVQCQLAAAGEPGVWGDRPFAAEANESTQQWGLNAGLRLYRLIRQLRLCSQS